MPPVSAFTAFSLAPISLSRLSLTLSTCIERGILLNAVKSQEPKDIEFSIEKVADNELVGKHRRVGEKTNLMTQKEKKKGKTSRISRR